MKRIARCQPRAWQRVLTTCLVLLVASSSGLLALDEEPSAEPKILLFRVLPNVVKGELWHEFHWETVNTDQVKLYRGEKEMPGRDQLPDGSIGWPLSMSGSLRTRLKTTTTFELVATNGEGESTRSSFVAEVAAREKPGKPPKPDKPPREVPAPPSSPTIKSFRVSPATAEPGGQIRFYWQVTKAARLRLYEGAHEIDLRGMGDQKTGEVGAFSTTIDETTTFRLVASDRARRETSKTFTVQVRGSTEPDATCAVRGQLGGKWRQEIREKATGPTSTWTVGVYIYGDGSDKPIARASVDGRGMYRFNDLTPGKRYRVRTDWESVPRQGQVTCSSGEIGDGPKFRVTGGPVLD